MRIHGPPKELFLGLVFHGNFSSCLLHLYYGLIVCTCRKIAWVRMPRNKTKWKYYERNNVERECSLWDWDVPHCGIDIRYDDNYRSPMGEHYLELGR
jgi:hypothetical protein